MYWLIAGLVIAGWMAVFISSRSTLRRTSADLRLEFQRQIDSLSAKIEALERTANAQAASPLAAAAARGTMEPRAANAPPTDAKAEVLDDITPETLKTITETVTALLGRKIRVRSVKILPTPHATVSSWAQHGRAVVQASHDFSQRSRP